MLLEDKLAPQLTPAKKGGAGATVTVKAVPKSSPPPPYPPQGGNIGHAQYEPKPQYYRREVNGD